MFEEYLLKFGYTDEQIMMLKKTYPIKRYAEATLLYNIKNITNYFKKSGLNNSDIIYITMAIPNIICSSIEDLKIKIDDLVSLGFKRLMVINLIKNYPYILQLNKQKVKDGMDDLLEIGFKQEEITKLIINYPIILTYGFSNLKKHTQVFLDYGYDINDTIFLLTEDFGLFDLSVNKIKACLAKYEKLGFNNLDIVKMTRYLPTLLTMDIGLFQDKFSYLTDLGYSFNDIINIIHKVPFIVVDFYLERSKSTIDYLFKIGFSKEEIKSMISDNLYILFYSDESLENKINNFIVAGFDIEKVISIINNCPIIFGYDDDTVKEKISFYFDINLRDYLITNSKILFINLDIVKSRYHYLNNSNQYSSSTYEDLFITDSDFEKKYETFSYGDDV